MIQATEVRAGNIILDTKHNQYAEIYQVSRYGELDCKLTEHDSVYLYDAKLEDLQPVLLTEENILKLRHVIRTDFSPLLFSMQPPGERQIENNYWSSWINEDYKLHLSPSYNHELINGNFKKTNIPEFWFCWLNGMGHWYLSLKPIRGNGRLKYLHQLQNLYFALTGEELTINL